MSSTSLSPTEKSEKEFGPMTQDERNNLQVGDVVISKFSGAYSVSVVTAQYFICERVAIVRDEDLEEWEAGYSSRAVHLMQEIAHAANSSLRLHT